MKLYDLILEYLDVAKYSIKKRTLLNYYQNINSYIRYGLGQKDILELDNNILNDYILSKYKGYGENGTLASSTLKITKTVINKSLEYGYNKGYLTQNIRVSASFKQNSSSKIETLTNYEANKV